MVQFEKRFWIRHAGRWRNRHFCSSGEIEKQKKKMFVITCVDLPISNCLRGFFLRRESLKRTGSGPFEKTNMSNLHVTNRTRA